jgi:UDP-3-O-[3-hydroxymyristoyl] glucosamine N-acyltransferase
MAVPEITGDPRFFARNAPQTVAAVAHAAGAAVPSKGEPGADLLLSGIAPLQMAGPQELSFLDNRRYLDALKATQAGAVIVSAALAHHVPAGCVALVTDQPYLSWARAASLFFPLPAPLAGVHPSAWVHPGAEVDATAEIGPMAVVEQGAQIGPRCRVAAGAVIGAGVVLGPDCRIGANASVSHALLGARVYIYPGARIGQDGFGFAVAPQGFVTVPQLGRVIIEDDVEIGANSCVDRGSVRDTVIGAGSRLDNLVQIGHNVRLGRCCVIVSQAGISGSTELGDFVQAGGQAGITGHLRIGARAKVGAQAGVMADVPEGTEVLGSPAQPVRDALREFAMVRRLARQYKPGKSAGNADSD